MTVPADLIETLTALRRELHRHPEVSGSEEETAQSVTAFLRHYAPHELITGLGGHGVAAVYRGAEAGPTVMVRCELDALPLVETSGKEHASTRPGAAHACGHDGHMAMVVGLAALLHREPPECGRAVLLFQPAEETGAGAAAVLGDPRFEDLRPDYAFALHNLPGLPRGVAGIRAGTFTCASAGLWVRLSGVTAHASQPGAGRSPADALCRLIPALAALPTTPAFRDRFCMVTVTHARLGEPSYGIAPGEAAVMVTLRGQDDTVMGDLVAAAREKALQLAGEYDLKVDTGMEDKFAAVTNHPEAVQLVERALVVGGIRVQRLEEPMLWSEDFGAFGVGKTRAALFTLGAGEGHAPLHSEIYDFPDAVIETGLRVFGRIIRNLLG